MKEDKRKTIMVNEAQFEAFEQRRKALDMNSSETLDVLLHQEVNRVTTLKIEPIGDFDYEAKKMTKKGDD